MATAHEPYAFGLCACVSVRVLPQSAGASSAAHGRWHAQVQLRHNKRKSDALKKLLATDQAGGGSSVPAGAGLAGVDGHSLGTTDLDPQAYASLLDEEEAAAAEALLHRHV